MDKFLDKAGLHFEDLHAEEREWLMSKVNALAEGQITVDKIRDAVEAMLAATEQQLISRKDAPTSFLSLLTFLIPIIGLIRKWYQDQYEVELKAKIKVLRGLKVVLTSADRQRKEIDQALANIASGLG